MTSDDAREPAHEASPEPGAPQVVPDLPIPEPEVASSFEVPPPEVDVEEPVSAAAAAVMPEGRRSKETVREKVATAARQASISEPKASIPASEVTTYADTTAAQDAVQARRSAVLTGMLAVVGVVLLGAAITALIVLTPVVFGGGR